MEHQTLFLLIFKNAIIEPENVIAPIAAPKDISIKLANLIFPTIPKLNASGLKMQKLQQKQQQDLLNYESQQQVLALLSLVF